MEFKEFDSIEILESLSVLSEKIHGTNAQIAISDDGTEIFAGSRNRWVTPEDDNYGFANWVYPNKDALIKLLGPGRHFGEWYGAGIGPGYGLTEKRFALFNTHRWTKAKADGLLLDRMDVVPVLYSGVFTPTIVRETMDKLRASGSVLVPGYMRPEGVVVFFTRTQTFFKQVFEKETWDKREKKDRPPVDSEHEALVASFMHPIRLEKLIMRDERYLREYPKTLPDIARDYVADLVKELEVPESVLADVKKKTFNFIRETYGK